MSDFVSPSQQESLVHQHRFYIEIKTPDRKKISIKASIFASYHSRFYGPLMIFNRELSKDELMILLETTKDHYRQILDLAEQHNIGNSTAFNLVILWLEHGLFGDKHGVNRYFEYDRKALIKKLNLPGKPPLDALRKDICFGAQHDVLRQGKRMVEKSFFEHLETHQSEILDNLDIEEVGQFGMSHEMRSDNLNTQSFWKKLQELKVQRGIRFRVKKYTFNTWMIKAVYTRNYYAHGWMLRNLDLLDYIKAVFKILETLANAPESHRKLERIHEALEAWNNMSMEDKWASMEELKKIVEILREKYQNDYQGFQTALLYWIDKILQKRRSDRAAEWPALRSFIKGVFKGTIGPDARYQPPATRTPLPIDELLDDESEDWPSDLASSDEDEESTKEDEAKETVAEENVGETGDLEEDNVESLDEESSEDGEILEHDNTNGVISQSSTQLFESMPVNSHLPVPPTEAEQPESISVNEDNSISPVHEQGSQSMPMNRDGPVFHTEAQQAGSAPVIENNSESPAPLGDSMPATPSESGENLSSKRKLDTEDGMGSEAGGEVPGKRQRLAEQ